MNNNKDQSYNQVIIKFLIILIFFFLSLLMAFLFNHTGKIIAGSDWLFHASRVEQILRNVKDGHMITFIASSTFHKTGVGSFMFYPTFFLYPWVFFRLFLNPIASFYLWYALITFIAFCVSYYCMLSYSSNKQRAFAFSLIYVLNPYRLYLGNAVFGEFIAASFLPLVFLGFYRLLFDNQPKTNRIPGWILLGIGMTLLTYSHLVSFIIISEVFLLVIIFVAITGNTRTVLFNNVNGILKSIALWFALDLPIIFLFVQDYIGKKVTSASFGISMNLVPKLSDVFDNSLINISGFGIGLILIITAIVGWYFVDNKVEIYTYALGIILLLISTSVFPWYAFKSSPLGIIQLTFRYLSFSALFLSIIASKICITLLGQFNIGKIISTILIIICSLLLYLAAQGDTFTYLNNNRPSNLSQKVNNIPLPAVYLNNNNYQYQFNYRAMFGETDYYPKASVNYENDIDNQIAILNGRKLAISSTGKPNKIQVKLQIKKNDSNIDLPIVAYRRTYVTVNGEKANFRISKRGTVYLAHLSKGINDIVVGFNPGTLFYITILLSILSWLGILCYAFLPYMRRV